jgi:(p)ppGpp synthase/HD superfamily hydrolase
MQDTLKAITDFADKAHGDQKRRYTPDRYIVHPIRVMELCKSYTTDVAVLAAALLHDVLEDTEVDKEALLDFLLQVMDERKARRTLALVVELTDVYTKAKYPTWNRRKRRAKETERLASSSKESQTVKYADILDNIRELPEDDDFSIVFLRECKNLLKKLNRGEPQLYQQTVEEVERRLKELGR